LILKSEWINQKGQRKPRRGDIIVDQSKKAKRNPEGVILLSNKAEKPKETPKG
jgi:hypothetical protein